MCVVKGYRPERYNVIMQLIKGARCFQKMVSMRDGKRLNTFVFLPADNGNHYHVILQRSPYGITTPQGQNVTDCTKGWLPDPNDPMRGSLLRGWHEITQHGYAAVYQDTRGRHGSEGEDHVYRDDPEDGYDTLEWIATQPWSNNQVGLSGSSAAATTALAAASQCHPSVRAFFTQAGGSNIYDDIVYEGQSIELERLWLWIANNIPGLSLTHRDAVTQRKGIKTEAFDRARVCAKATYLALDTARSTHPHFIENDQWMHLPLTDYPDFSVCQPYLNEILSHPAPDAFRTKHNFRATIDVPGFHVTTWYDIFLTSVLAAFSEIQSRSGNQRLWIGPNGHYFIYQKNFWPRDPYFEWFDHWLKDEPLPIVNEPAIHYSPQSWTTDAESYLADDWHYADEWPLPHAVQHRLYFSENGHLCAENTGRAPRSYLYDPNHPIPTLGGRNMAIDEGPLDQRPVQALPNYGLIYRGKVLDEDLTIAGPVVVTLHVQSNCPDTDFVAKLIEFEPDGRTTLLMDGVIRAMYRQPEAGAQRLQAEKIYRVSIHLTHLHHTVQTGSCLQVDITSSNFPRRARNTNSGNAMLANDTVRDIQIATNVIHHSERHPSFIDLCILPSALPSK